MRNVIFDNDRIVSINYRDKEHLRKMVNQKDTVKSQKVDIKKITYLIKSQINMCLKVKIKWK